MSTTQPQVIAVSQPNVKERIWEKKKSEKNNNNNNDGAFALYKPKTTTMDENIASTTICWNNTRIIVERQGES